MINSIYTHKSNTDKTPLFNIPDNFNALNLKNKYRKDFDSKVIKKSKSIENPDEKKITQTVSSEIKKIDNFSDEDKKTIEKLKVIEREVRAHENSHIGAGGGLVRGGAVYSYQVGPDGKRYIAGGEVQIDTSPVPDNPHATILKMQQVRRAALAPADPSSQDRTVANEASEKEAEARFELSKKQMENFKNKSGGTSSHFDLYA